MDFDPKKHHYEIAMAFAKSAIKNNPWHAFAEDMERVIEHCENEIKKRTITCGSCNVRCDNSWCVTRKDFKK